MRTNTPTDPLARIRDIHRSAAETRAEFGENPGNVDIWLSLYARDVGALLTECERLRGELAEAQAAVAWLEDERASMLARGAARTEDYQAGLLAGLALAQEAQDAAGKPGLRCSVRLKETSE